MLDTDVLQEVVLNWHRKTFRQDQDSVIMRAAKVCEEAGELAGAVMNCDLLIFV